MKSLERIEHLNAGITTNQLLQVALTQLNNNIK